jgi:hypothetical protein
MEEGKSGDGADPDGRLHNLSAEEILKESGSRKDASMRHFTGALRWCKLLGSD